MDSTKEECCADLRIRPMSVADLPGVLEVERECFSVPWSERIFLDMLDLDGSSYAVFVPANIEEMDVNDPDYGLIFLRCREEDGEEFFDSIDDDAELERVYDAYQTILDAEEEE